jgi:hypothetical protein
MRKLPPCSLGSERNGLESLTPSDPAFAVSERNAKLSARLPPESGVRPTESSGSRHRHWGPVHVVAA